MDSEHWEAHFDIYAGLHGKSLRVELTLPRVVKILMNLATERRTPRTSVRGKQYFMHFTNKLQKINISRKTLATHLAELRDPLLGRDPQFGKRCTTLLKGLETKQKNNYYSTGLLINTN